MSSDAVVERLGLADIQALRVAVLRRGTPATTAVYDGDDLPTTVHIGARRDGVVVATSTWIHAAWPHDPALPAVQLRGMAVDDSLQGTGIGRRLIHAGLAHAREVGARVVWAKARDSALAFYERCEFQVVGDQFIEPASGMPHHLVVREVN
jgi:predicted N-acetyltransferase YhbS